MWGRLTVAGAMREDIISDFREAGDKAVASGATLQDFMCIMPQTT